MNFLFIFMDGVGLGANDATTNPFAVAKMPNIKGLLDGKHLIEDVPPIVNGRATLLALDAGLGVEGLPQSASGQATLLTGRNIPGEIGLHYGPKPNPAIQKILNEENLFITLEKKGYRSTLLNAYPPRYFQAIESGHRMYSAIPLAVTSAGIPLMTIEDLYAGKALAADFTGKGWRDQLGFSDTPVFEPKEAGEKLAALAKGYDFAFFEFWISDLIGHRQDMENGLKMLGTIDQVLGGLIDAWDDESGLILITSDHGNMEDLSTRRHTNNQVPCLLIGSSELRSLFVESLADLTDVTPAILRFFEAIPRPYQD